MIDAFSVAESLPYGLNLSSLTEKDEDDTCVILSTTPPYPVLIFWQNTVGVDANEVINYAVAVSTCVFPMVRVPHCIIKLFLPVEFLNII